MSAPTKAVRSLGDNVYIVYLDDSKQEKGKGAEFQVISAAIVKDEHFDALEQHLAWSLYESVESKIAEGFEELHASDLLSQNPPFEKVERAKALEILSDAVAAIEGFAIPIVYGAIDLRKLYAANYATANPIDMAFRICVKLVEEWFQTNDHAGLGLLISDESSNQQIKRAMQNAFHLFRNRVNASPAVRGILEHLHDDMYFGDSKHSIGIQLADMCTFLIGRHLAGYSDTEDLYLRLEEHIFKGIIEPV